MKEGTLTLLISETKQKFHEDGNVGINCRVNEEIAVVSCLRNDLQGVTMRCD